MKSLLMKLGDGQGHLKAGFLGFGGSGKTFTSMLLAVAVRRHFGLEGPVAMFDTEGGSEYVAPHLRALTGKDLFGVRSRSLDDLIQVGKECVEAGVSVLIADSMTHVWRELCDAYLAQVNESLLRRNFRKRSKLEFQDWATVKAIWSKWTDFYLNAPLHIIIAGRAGYEYDMEQNEETGRKELIKTGIKMKTEGEFGFEPSLLVEMERDQEATKDGKFKIVRRATVLKDRFGIVDGKSVTLGESAVDKALEQTWEFFRPHVALLTAGAHAQIDTRLKTDAGIDDEGDGEWARERKTRTILCEEIQGELVNAFPGQTAAEKKAKTDLLFKAFDTRSWTAVESLYSDKLRLGLESIRAELWARAEKSQAEGEAASA